jgi:hypothetical protein
MMTMSLVLAALAAGGTAQATEKGVVGGAATGAVGGALVGGPIGAVVGGVGGAIVGNHVTNKHRRLRHRVHHHDDKT